MRRIHGHKMVLGCFSVLTLLAAAMAACSSGSQSLASKYVASAVIGKAGGTIPVTASDDPALAGTTIVIPPNALSADTTITIGLATEMINPKNSVAAGPVVDFEPSGTIFALPVTVNIPVTSTSGSIFIEAVEGTGSTSRIEPTSVSAGLATFQINGFTMFGACVVTGDAGIGCTTNADCATGQDCVSGECAGPSTSCGDGVCSSSEDCQSCPADCGQCSSGDGGLDAQGACTSDSECGPGFVCISGQCSGLLPPDAGHDVNTVDAGDASVCAAPEVDCDGLCTDVTSDPNNCGACGEACPTGSACSAGVCGIDAGTDAGASCATDADCPTGQVCVDDLCQS